MFSVITVIVMRHEVPQLSLTGAVYVRPLALK